MKMEVEKKMTSLNGKKIVNLKLNFLGISDAKKVGKESQKLANHFTLYYSGALSNERNKGMVKFKAVNPGIIRIEVEGDFSLNILQIHALFEDDKFKKKI